MNVAEPTQTPHLRRQGSAPQLIVGGQSFLVLGGELHNSSASNSEYMRPIWERLVALNLNTVLAVVAWELVFGAGPETDEIFMAWNYARYVNHIAAAGKAAYDLPLYVNAWLNNPDSAGDSWASGGQKPGDWPSGGALSHTLDIWRAGAPQIDIFAPDIYFGDFETWCKQYTRRGNPLFIPEMRRDADGARGLRRDWAMRGDRHRAIRHRLNRESR